MRATLDIVRYTLNLCEDSLSAGYNDLCALMRGDGIKEMKEVSLILIDILYFTKKLLILSQKPFSDIALLFWRP
jgi:hypothetical protein